MISGKELSYFFTGFDLKRLEAYSRNLVDYHMILDLIPVLSHMYFCKRLEISLSYAQAAILLGLGLQHKTVSDVGPELKLESKQVLALFNKSVRKAVKYLRSIEEEHVSGALNLPPRSAASATALRRPLTQSLEDELHDGQRQVSRELAEKQKKLMSDMDLSEYAIGGTDEQWSSALGGEGKVKTTVSLVSSKKQKKRPGSSSDKQKKKSSSNKKHRSHK